MDFEDILIEIGESGRFQKRLIYVFLLPAALLLPFFCMTTLFMISSPNHWCIVPQLENFTVEEKQQFIRPRIVVNDESVFDSCNMYDINYDDVAINGNLSEFYKNITSLTTKPCDNGWEYDHTYYDNTAVTALNLVCDDSHYVSLILSIGLVGTAIGTPLFGVISDKIGRRKTFIITVFVLIISSISPTILKDLKSFIIFRCINGLIMPSIFQIPYVVLIEIVGPTMRTQLAGIGCISWVVGFCMLPLLAYLTRDWVLLNIIATFSGFIFFGFWKFLPESPRWLLSKDRYEETAQILERIAKVNHKPVPNDLISKLKKINKKQNNDNELLKSDKYNHSVIPLLIRPNLRKNLILITLNWIANAFAYFGISLNLFNFHGNEFVNFFLLGIIELPSYCVGWYLMGTRFGRRWSNVFLMFGCGISLSIPALIPSSMTTFTNVMVFIGKFCVSGSFMIVYQQAAEVYPTPVRNQALAIGSMASSLVSIGLPYLAYLGRYGVWIPLLIIGIVNIIFAFTSTFIPETLNENLPQTIDDGDNFGKGNKYFSFARTNPVIRFSDKNSNSEVKPMNDV